MTDTTVHLELPYLLASQADKHVSVNEALSRIDAVTQASIISRSLKIEPLNPAVGDSYLLPSEKTGANWRGLQQGALVVFDAGGWMQVTPRDGWQIYVQDEAEFFHYQASQWYIRAGQHPNLLINGAFQIWQRGQTFTAPAVGDYLCDRWFVRSPTGTVTKSSDAPTAGLSSLELANADGAIAQRIESAMIATSASKLGVRVAVKSISGTATATLKLRRPLLRDDFTGTDLIASKTFPLNSDRWTTLEWHDIELSSLALLGLELEIGFQGAAGGARIACAQGHLRGLPVCFPHVPAPLEQQRCERYFEKSWAPDNAPGTFSINGGSAFGQVHPTGNFRAFTPFRGQKAKPPVIKVYAANGSAGKITYYDGSWRDTGQLSVIVPTPSVNGFYCGHNIPGSIETQFGWTAEAEL